jgi:hypothetical protein
MLRGTGRMGPHERPARKECLIKENTRQGDWLESLHNGLNLMATYRQIAANHTGNSPALEPMNCGKALSDTRSSTSSRGASISNPWKRKPLSSSRKYANEANFYGSQFSAIDNIFERLIHTASVQNSWVHFTG